MNLEEKTKILYISGLEAAKHFCGMFPGEQLSSTYTDSVFEELEMGLIGLTRSEFLAATQIALNEISQLNELKIQAQMAVKGLLIEGQHQKVLLVD